MAQLQFRSDDNPKKWPLRYGNGGDGDKVVSSNETYNGAYVKTGKSKVHKTDVPRSREEKDLENDGTIDVKTEKGEKMAIVRGRDIETGLPKSLRLTETEIREALSPCISEIIQGVSDVIEEAPPELLSDILENGILLTGGGAYLAGLDQLIVEQIRMPVIVSDDPLTSVARGTGKVLENPDLLSRIKIFSGNK